MTCAHCLGFVGSCHVCHGKGTVLYGLLAATIGWAWAVPGCNCDACKRNGPQPREELKCGT